MNFRLLAALFSAFLVFGVSASEPTDLSIVKEIYRSSQNLPDEHAFRLFLGMLFPDNDPSMHDPDRHIARAIGAEQETETGAARIDHFYDWFDAAQVQIERQSAAATIEKLCSGNWQEWTFDEVVDGVDAAGAAKNQIYKEHYQMTLEMLTENERSAFLTFMERIKSGTAMTVYDTEAFYEHYPEQDIHRYQALACEDAQLAVLE